MATIEDGKAMFDAADLSTRLINLELRWLIYEEGILDVTVQNPGAKHSIGVGILQRCRITLRGQPGLLRRRADRRAGGHDHRPGGVVGVPRT